MSGKFFDAQNQNAQTKMDYILERACNAGVRKIVVTGLKMNGCQNAVTKANTCHLISAAIGIHPHFVDNEWKDGKTIDKLEELLKKDQAKPRKTIVAIGEVGLDFARDYSQRDTQKEAFSKQVALAKNYKKPLLVHERDSFDEVMDILAKQESSEDPLPPVVMHCFTGNVEQIKTCVAKGFYIGVTGYVCKKDHGAELLNAIKDGHLGLESIILQSNAPYMVPNMQYQECDPISRKLLEHCHENNEPCSIPVIVRHIAKQLGKDAREVARVLNENAMTVFDFDSDQVRL